MLQFLGSMTEIAELVLGSAGHCKFAVLEFADHSEIAKFSTKITSPQHRCQNPSCS